MKRWIKQASLTVLLCCWASLCLAGLWHYQQLTEQQKVYQALAQVSQLGWIIDEWTITGQSELITDLSAQAVFEQIAQNLGQPVQMWQIGRSTSPGAGDSYPTLTAQTNMNQWQWHIRIKTLPDWNHQMVLTLETTYAGCPDETEEQLQQARLTEIFRDLWATLRLTTCLVGHQNGKLDEDASKRLLVRWFQSLKAVVQNQIWDGRVASVSGYLPGLPNGRVLGGILVNLHAALRYHSQTDATYLVCASPVIIREY